MRLDGDGRGDYVKTEDFRKVEQQRDELLNHLEILVGGRPEFWDADGWFTYKEVSDAQEAICSVKANNAS